MFDDDSNCFRTRTYSRPQPAMLARAGKPVRILHISDLHFGAMFELALWHDIGRVLADSETPDVIAGPNLRRRPMRICRSTASGCIHRRSSLDAPVFASGTPSAIPSRPIACPR